MKTILVTGHAGFIGSALVQRLFKEMGGGTIVGVDNCNDYYDINLKRYRLDKLRRNKPYNIEYVCIYGDITNRSFINNLFDEYKFDIVVNLAAQPGVRNSIDNPHSYIENNIIGFHNILEACRSHPVQHLIYASSSSVYGDNKKVPFSITDRVDIPINLYAVTKRCDELMAYCYGKLYNIPSTGLRFFTVYGPAGRPDMAYFDFTNKLVNGETIPVYNQGKCSRDFTYIDDITEGIMKVISQSPVTPNQYRIYNLGCGHPVNLMEFIRILHEELINAGALPVIGRSMDYNIESHIQLAPMQPGDIPITYADTTEFEQDFGFTPKTPLREGLRKFSKWYVEYYKL